MKKCSLCKEIKSKKEFYRHCKAKDGLQSNCKICHSKTSNLWKLRNPEVAKKWFSVYRDKNVEKAKEYGRKWRIKNSKRHKEKNARWKKENLSLVSLYAAKRRAISLKSIPSWSNNFFIQEIYDLAQRRTKTLGVKYSVDHIVPLISKKVCGLHWEGNLRVIPLNDNAAKANRSWPDMP